MLMTYVARGPKKAVNMTLSEDLVRDARALTSNLSETVEQLLAGYVFEEQERRAEKEWRIDESLRLLKEHEAQHGVWGEEYCEL
jgi:post-segregation antitoxin (ccd killing protein)